MPLNQASFLCHLPPEPHLRPRPHSHLLPSPSPSPSLQAGCAELSCKANCSGHGACTLSGCACEGGWSGADCATPPCAVGVEGKVCSGHGACVAGECSCYQGFSGPGCGVKHGCLGDGSCSGHGRCLATAQAVAGAVPLDGPAGYCTCDAGWTGPECEVAVLGCLQARPVNPNLSPYPNPNLSPYPTPNLSPSLTPTPKPRAGLLGQRSVRGRRVHLLRELVGPHLRHQGVPARRAARRAVL